MNLSGGKCSLSAKCAKFTLGKNVGEAPKLLKHLNYTLPLLLTCMLDDYFFKS
jgi:hypothetical protein